MRKAVFFDRDGTINEEVGYIKDLNKLKLIKNASKSIKKIKDNGFLAVLVTNQSGPARGYYNEEWVKTLNNKLQELLMNEGTCLDKMYYCPHLPDGIIPEYSIECECRKPNIGLFLKAKKELNIDLNSSYMIGDKATDVEAGHNAGMKSILLKTGYGRDVLDGKYQSIPNPDYIAEDINDAVDWILKVEGIYE
ncbi:MAG: D-glycero-D-manno-heptose-1,7-bisphosphate 7-phosphatase [Candidatus Sericytochromatia bacterium]|nr:MAG: D-glycero-D-manno-heptose-1,7-bisphosphate 7-phosphatase [Candidatus Sericytochromatia bacterium]